MQGSLTPDEVNEFLADVFPSSHADGTRCLELGERMAVAHWPYDDGELRPGGYISGPRMFALADSALWFASFTVLGLEAMAVTSELSIRFLRPAKDGDLLARAVLNSVSTRRLVGTVEIWVDGAPDRLVAAAQGSYARP